MPTKSDHQVDISPQAQEYLEAVCRVVDRGEVPTLTELSRELNVAPPSVIGMLRRLAEQGLLSYSKKTGAVFTPQGQACAEAIRRRHRLAERLLTDLLGVPWTRAHEIACRFEHVIDDEIERYLRHALDHPETCPHGNPIDDTPAVSLQPLTTMRPGQSGCLRRVVNESEPMLEYFQHMGLQPGAIVTVCDIAPLDGPLTVEVEGERHALSRAMADFVLVEMEESAL